MAFGVTGRRQKNAVHPVAMVSSNWYATVPAQLRNLEVRRVWVVIEYTACVTEEAA